MSYRNTLQADALKLVAKKLQSSLAVEGELPEDGLAAYGDDGDDLMMALARKTLSGEAEDEADTVECAFAQARQAESAAAELLVDEDWKSLEVEPEVVPVNGNGTNGHGDSHGSDSFGPTVELAPVFGHLPGGNGNGSSTVNGNGHGHNNEADEPQRSPFSWAEFMAEETSQPKRRGRKAQPASMSMFEWAVELERQRETVGAGR